MQVIGKPCAWYCALEFFGTLLNKHNYTYAMFGRDTGAQKVVASAIQEFLEKDPVFRVIAGGAQPVSSVTPPGLTELGEWITNMVKVGAENRTPTEWEILDQIRANAVLKAQVGYAKGPELLRVIVQGS